MEKDFIIYIDRLKKDVKEYIDLRVSSEFLDIHSEELKFAPHINIKGCVYLQKEFLIIQLNITATAELPCRICNELTSRSIYISSFYHAKEIAKLKQPVYDYGNQIREAILLEVPSFIECQQNGCPHRDELKKYFSKQENSSSRLPFAEIDQV